MNTASARLQAGLSTLIPYAPAQHRRACQTETSGLMTENKPGKSSDDDPVAAQLRFEAALYGDWYSQSILTSYVQEKSSEKSYPKVCGGPQARP